MNGGLEHVFEWMSPLLMVDSQDPRHAIRNRTVLVHAVRDWISRTEQEQRSTAQRRAAQQHGEMRGFSHHESSLGLG